jgi:hypothetical protein
MAVALSDLLVLGADAALMALRRQWFQRLS